MGLRLNRNDEVGAEIPRVLFGVLKKVLKKVLSPESTPKSAQEIAQKSTPAREYSKKCSKECSLPLRFEERAGDANMLARAHLSHNFKFHRPNDHLTHSLPYNVLQRSDPSKHSVQRKTIDHGMRSSMLPSVVLSFCWHPALCIVNCLQLAELALCLSCLVLSCLATLHLSPLAKGAILVFCICICLCFYVTFWDTLK